MLPVEPFHQTLDGCFLIGAGGGFVVFFPFFYFCIFTSAKRCAKY